MKDQAERKQSDAGSALAHKSAAASAAARAFAACERLSHFGLRRLQPRRRPNRKRLQRSLACPTRQPVERSTRLPTAFDRVGHSPTGSPDGIRHRLNVGILTPLLDGRRNCNASVESPWLGRISKAKTKPLICPCGPSLVTAGNRARLNEGCCPV